VATRNRFSVRGVFNIKKPTRATVLEHPRFRSLRLVIFFLLPINQLCPKLCGVSWFEKLMQTYLLGDEESAVWIQSSRWRFGLRRSATDSSLWLKNASKRLFTYIQNIVDRIFFEVPGKAGAQAVAKKNVLRLISVSGLLSCFTIVYSFSTLGDSFIEESHMVVVHEFGDQEVQPNIRP
jgi:hypothetical protein